MKEVNGYEVYMVDDSYVKSCRFDLFKEILFMGNNPKAKFDNLKMAKSAKKLFKKFFPEDKFCIKGF